MAQINRRKRTLSGPEAANLLLTQLAQVTDVPILARPESDDGGAHIALYIECRVPGAPLDPLVKETLGVVREHHWRVVPIKVPWGWIEVMEEFLG